MTKKEVAGEYRRLLADVEMQHAFNFNNHGTINNIVQMHKTIATCSPKDFEYHINDKKNDVADWVHNILGDTVLASQLRQTTSKKTTEALIKYRINEASAYVSHLHEPHARKTHELSAIVDQITHLENDMEHTLGHTSKSAVFKYPAEKDPKLIIKNRFRDFTVGLAMGVLFGFILAKASGVI